MNNLLNCKQNILLILTTLILSLPGVTHAGEVQVHELRSRYQSAPTSVRVLTPDRIKPEVEYPTLYLLPVEPGTEVKWGDPVQEARKLDLANRHQMICVFPTFADLPWYADHPSDEQLQQETYFLKDVLPLVEKNYPVTEEASRRYLLGFSKSGWGAWSLLLRHSDRFYKALAWDAPLMLDHPGPYGTKPIFGTEENFKQYELSRHLAKHAPNFQSEPRLYHWGYDAFRKHHQQMGARLSELKIKSVYRDGPFRKHHWESGWLEDAVELLLSEPD